MPNDEECIFAPSSLPFQGRRKQLESLISDRLAVPRASFFLISHKCWISVLNLHGGTVLTDLTFVTTRFVASCVYVFSAAVFGFVRVSSFFAQSGWRTDGERAKN